MEELINVVKAEVMSSLEIAEITGKRHDHVVRDIRNLVEKINQLRFERGNNSNDQTNQPKFGVVDNTTGNQRDTKFDSKFSSTAAEGEVLNFHTGNDDCTSYIVRSESYKDAKGELRAMFTLNKKACLLLASGYDVVLRAKIIDRWEELERKEQRNTDSPSYQIEDPIKRAERWIEEEKERQRLQFENQKQEQLLIEQQPKVVLADAITASERSFPIKELATILAQNGVKIGPTRLRRFLVDNHYLGSRGECYMMPRQRYIEQGLFEVIEELEYDSYYNRQELKKTVMVTGKGLKYFINKFLNNKK